MKYFIICKYSNIRRYLSVKEYVEAIGDYEMTHDWYASNPQKEEFAFGSKKHQQIVLLDIQGIREADIVYGILPGGNDFYVELGVALAFDKKVKLIGLPEHEKEFQDTAYHGHPNIEFHIEETQCMAGCPDRSYLLG